MTKDNKGQQYSNPQDRAFADIFVIGRGIYNSKSPKEEILKYKKLIDSL